MLESLDFHYNGISSIEMGLLNVNTEGGLFEELFLPNRTINTMTVKGNSKSYLQSIERENISLPLSFLLPEKFNESEIKAIKQWLYQDYYKEFYFDDYPDKRFYMMYDGDFTIVHTGNGQGYVKLTLVSNSPFSYSPYYTVNLTANDAVNGITYAFKNEGDLPIYPEIWMKITAGSGRVQIVNQTTNKTFEFNNLALNETVYVDNEKEDILTDLALTYRYNNHNGNFLELVRGTNTLKIIGQCTITLKYRYTNLM